MGPRPGAPAPDGQGLTIDLTDRDAPPGLTAPGPATAALYARLGEEDRAEVEQRLDDETRPHWDAAAPQWRPGITLAFGVHHRVRTVLEKTGLTTDEPPEDVHAMGRGPLAAGGAYYYADIVAEGLATAGAPLRAGMKVLDFGCSTGRVLRVLAVVHRDIEWHGCDPNAPAIRWAGEHLAQLGRFDISPQAPPLPARDDTYDAVYAISIWSHFGEDAAQAWLSEMRRVIRPGGHLLLTTQGWQTLAHESRRGAWSQSGLRAAAQAAYRHGGYYFEAFGEAGDWGVRDRQWGFAIYTAEWLLERVLPRWRVAWYVPGTVEGNQDLWVLQRSS